MLSVKGYGSVIFYILPTHEKYNKIYAGRKGYYDSN